MESVGFEEAVKIMKNDLRACVKCGRKIEACMGFCKAGDVLDLIEGRRTDRPRELCGLCVIFWQWDADGNIIPQEPEPWLLKIIQESQKKPPD